MSNDFATFGAALRRLIDHLDGELERVYRGAGLDFRPRFTPVLRAIEAAGPQSIGTLAATLGVSHSAASQTVTQMNARGLLASTPGRDARARIVALTPAAKTLLPQLAPIWAAAEAGTRELDAACDGALVAAVSRANAALAERGFGARVAAHVISNRPPPAQ